MICAACINSRVVYMCIMVRFSHLCHSRNAREITVTLIDANHCPGSAMFVFQGASIGTILHTGNN